MYKVKKPFEITLYFDSRPFLKLNDGYGVIKLRVYSREERKTKIKSLGKICNKSTFNHITDLSKKPSGKDYELILFARQKLSSAQSINDYSICKSLSQFFGELQTKKSSILLKDAFEQRLNSLKKSQVTTKSHTKLSKEYLEEFKNDKLTFYDVNVSLLEKFEEFLKEKKNHHQNSIKNYIKPIREIFTNAISDNSSPITKADYPFYTKQDNKNGFKIKSVSVKRTHKILKLDEIQLLLDYKPQTEYEKRAIDFFKFSFYGYGMNVMDIMSIKNEHIKGDSIFFTREKGNENQNQYEVTIKIRKEIKEILDYWNTGNVYVFPFFKQNMSKEKRIAIKQTVNSVNRVQLKKIAKKIGVNPKVSHGWARTAYATWMVRNNVDKHQVSQTMGHTDERSFKNYWKGYDNVDDIQNIYDEKFKKPSKD